MPPLLEHILPVFLVLGAGAGLRAAGVADDRWTEVINRYALYAGFPVLIFANLAGIGRSALAGMFPVVWLNAALMAGLIGVTAATARLAGLPRKRANTYVICLFFGNVAYLGYPVVTSVYPETEVLVSILVSVYVAVLFTGGVFVLELSRKQRGSVVSILGGMVKNPFIVAVAAGFAAIYTGVSLPQPAARAMDMIRASVSPMVLVALGVFLVRRIDLRSLLRPTLVLSMLKLAAVPAFFYLVLRSALPPGTPGTALQVSVLEAAMPVAVTPFALSTVYPLDRELVGSSIVLSTLLSALTLPLLIFLLG
ncbi:MAG: AEC family transporter [Spirochaetota bacterium]